MQYLWCISVMGKNVIARTLVGPSCGQVALAVLTSIPEYASGLEVRFQITTPSLSNFSC